MIDFPPPSSPGSRPGVSSTSRSAESGAVQDPLLALKTQTQAVKAEVLEAKLVEQSGNDRKAIYEMMVRARLASESGRPVSAGAGKATDTGASSATVSTSSISPPIKLPAQTTPSNQPDTARQLPSSTASAAPLPHSPITRITPEVLAALQQGQELIIKLRSELALAPSTRLLATLSVDQGMVLTKAIAPDPIPAQGERFRQLIPVQRSLAALMSTLENLRTLNKADNAALPAPVRQELQNLMRLLPRIAQIQQPGYLQDAVRNNGTFLEANLTQAVRQHVAELAQTVNLAKGHPSDPNQSQSGTSTKSAQSTPAASNTETSRPVNQNQTVSLLDSLKHLGQRLVENRQATTPGQTNSPTIDQSAPETLKTLLQQVTTKDLKQALQNLQKALQQAQPAGEQSAGDKLVNKVANDSIAANPQKNADVLLKSLMQAQMTGGKAFVPDAAEDAVKTHPGLRRYHAEQASSNVSSRQDSVREQPLLPPLPGQILIQPQSRQTAEKSGSELADALVSILLKQVKGALARTTLHQLASQPRQADNPVQAPLLLSFEIPFLHHQQIQVIQFRIEEEKHSSEESEDKDFQKRWTVQMGFDIEGLGPLLCQINLVGVSASVSFWAEWENTLEHTRSHFEFLQNTLTGMGLKVDKLQGHLGIPANERTLLSNQLVDIRL